MISLPKRLEQSKIISTSHSSQTTLSTSLIFQHRNGESLTTNPTMSDHHTTHNHPPADGATNSDPYYAYTDDTDSNNYCTPILPVPTNFSFLHIVIHNVQGI